jgi:hypothetical protein
VPLPVDALDCAELSVRDAALAIGSGHLHAIARGKGALRLSIKRDAL